MSKKERINNKYLVILLFFILIISIAIFYLSKKKDTNNKVYDLKNKQQEYEEILDMLSFNIENYKIFVKKTNPSNILFVPNFTNPKTSDEVIAKYECNILINGGYYDENRNPVGLYHINGYEYSKTNNLDINSGIAMLVNESDIDIFGLSTYNHQQNTTAMQSSPLLVHNYTFTDKSLDDTNKGRRILLSVDNNDSTLIITIVDKNNYNSGPTLNKTVNLLKTLNDRENLKIKDSLNLDGGDSSVYVDNILTLKESVFSGSFLCFK